MSSLSLRVTYSSICLNKFDTSRIDAAISVADNSVDALDSHIDSFDRKSLFFY